MFFNRKFNAFSLVELMMILLVASLITAALFPVVTKKHFRLPTLVNHGAYLCYYQGGKLHEAKWAGKMKTKELFNRETDNCVFTPPKKAGYFEISVIGGGGGGGDAGYTGGDWISSIVETEMSPFQRTEEELKEHGITKSEFLKYAGWVMGYANSIGSGSGGDIGYMTRSTDPIHRECLEYEQVDVDDYADAKTCKAEWVDGKCQFYTCATGKKCTDSLHEYPCTYTTPKVCKTKNPLDCKDVKICDDCECEGGYETVTVSPEKEGDPISYCCMRNAKGCLSAEYECGDGSGGTYDQTAGVWETTTRTVTPTIPAVTKQECKKWGPKYKTVCTGGDCAEWSGGDEVKTTCTETITTCETYTTEDKFGDPQEISESACKADNTTTKIKIGSHKADGDCINERTWLTYTYNHNTNYGESGGSGANCRSSELAGNTNLTGSGKSTINASDVTNGSSLDLSRVAKFFLQYATAGFGTASCYPRKAGAQSCDGKPSYSSYSISGNGSTSVTAYSAEAGGNGAGRTIIDGDDIDPKWDDPVDAGHARINGYCSGNDIDSPSCSGSGYYGYCLVHHYKPSVAETDGMYKYEFGRDTNYLGYGEPGQPGEFKTTIVRTLKGVDTTIKVGRGGSAAALNSGGKGTAGSKTSFGDIISAAGGAGGKGMQTLTSEELPVYDAARYEKESKCFYYSQAFAKKADGSYLKADDERVISTKTLTYGEIRQQLQDEPDYCNDLKDSQSNYKYFRVSTNDAAQNYPTPVGIFSSFLNLAFKNLTGSEDNPLERFTKSGRGGKAGAVEHRCWAGRGEVIFEGVVMTSSVFADADSANEIKNNPDYDWPSGFTPKYVPSTCRNDYSNIPAGPGADGAVLIKW